MEARVSSRLLPPWFQTEIALTPTWTARHASSTPTVAWILPTSRSTAWSWFSSSTCTEARPRRGGAHRRRPTRVPAPPSSLLDTPSLRLSLPLGQTGEAGAGLEGAAEVGASAAGHDDYRAGGVGDDVP
jgi:hypothetical protein